MAAAMSYVPISDESLLDRAELVVTGEVTRVAPSPGQPLDATEYDVRVDQTLKGDAFGDIAVSVPGSLLPQRDGALNVPGAPHLDQAEHVLLFLNSRADGKYDISQLALGTFHVRTTRSGEQVLLRDLSGAEPWDSPGVTGKADVAGANRSVTGFSTWLRARAVGLDISSDYWNNSALAEAPKFAVFGGTPPRWFQFDNGGTLTMYAGQQGQAGLSGGGYSQVQAAMQAWNRDSGSNVRFAYGGLTGANGGLNRSDGTNAVLFNDPNGDIAGSYSCTGGGIVAMTVWRSGGTRNLNGRTFQVMTEADTVVQDGAGCALSGTGNGAEVLGHELGHAIGFAHPCGDSGLVACVTNALFNDALMRPTMHGDGRGASLRSDDIAGAAFLYPNIAASTPPPSGGGGSGGGGGGSGSGSSGGGNGGAMDGQALAALMLFCLVSALRQAPLRRQPAFHTNGSRPASGTSPVRRRA